MLQWFSCPYNPRKLQSPGRALLTQHTEKGISAVFGMTVHTSDDILLRQPGTLSSSEGIDT